MARRSTESSAGEPLSASAGSCGCVVRLLGAGATVLAFLALSLLLIAGNPDRWQGIGDPASHPLALASDPSNPRRIYLSTEQGEILISQDAGQSWSASHQGLPPATPISALEVLPGGTRLLAGTSVGAYRSSDSGRTWQSAGAGIPAKSIVDAVRALPDGTLLAGTANNGVYVLTPGGTTWVPAAAGLPPRSDVYNFLSLPQRGYVLATLISGGIYASQDSGMTWARSDTGLGRTSGASGTNVFSLLVVPGQGSARPSILAGTSRGVYVSR
ncbi:MAG: hypothetical protein IVW57_04625, partial [Ktedonobacterales bacterium]|nr:hypothetical protein [Ktedonobacterales bacterium]